MSYQAQQSKIKVSEMLLMKEESSSSKQVLIIVRQDTGTVMNIDGRFDLPVLPNIGLRYPLSAIYQRYIFGRNNQCKYNLRSF